MSDKKLVSIIVPCYNHEEFLDDCIRGILDQSYDAIEVLICDDCSPDNSYEKIKTYEMELTKRFSRVVLIRNETNQGVTKNINGMLSLANGEYIKIIASDDVLLPTAVQSAVEYFESHLDKNILICNGAKIPENQHYGQFIANELVYLEAPNFEAENFLEEIYKLNIIFAPGAFVKKTVFEKVGYYDENIAIEDWEFWLRVLSKKAGKFGYIKQPLVLYRINENSMTSLSNNSKLEMRRIRIYKAEMDILYKFKGFVSEEFAAHCVLNKILTEKNIAISRRLYELERIIDKDLKAFTGWKNLPMKSRIKYALALGKIYVKKCIRK